MAENQVNVLIKKLYGNQNKRVQHLKNSVGSIPNVMGTKSRNQRELANINKSGYNAAKALEADSHRFGSDNVGFSTDAINNIKQDIKDIKNSRTDELLASQSEKFIKSDREQIRKDNTVPKDELVMISSANNGDIVGKATSADVEFIYHNTHDSEREISQRHPNKLFYTYHDAQIDAKKDLQ